METRIRDVASDNSELNVTTAGTVVHGSVHRDDGGAVAEARVFFSASPVEVPDIALLTDGKGRFTMHAPAPGHYEVSCHADGLEPTMVAIDLVAGQEEVQVDIELRTVAQ